MEKQALHIALLVVFSYNYHKDSDSASIKVR